MNEEYEYNDNDRFCLTPWGCLYVTLEDYNVDTSNIKGKVGEHLVEDFMELMVKQGYIGKSDKMDLE